MRSLPAVSRHEAVVLHPSRDSVPQHEAVVHHDIAMRIADLMDIPFDGLYDAARHEGRSCYIVPSATLVGAPIRAQLDIHDELDLFGGCVSHAFMATKAITHGLIGGAAQQPQGWSDAFSTRVKPATLSGYSVFSVEDLRQAAARLLDATGPIRLKPVLATAGRGQICIRTIKELNQALEQPEITEEISHGMVLEAHLEEVVTYSVGQVRLPGLTTSYIGTQCLTRDNDGEEVYGGSRLRFVRGDYNDLYDLPLDEDRRKAVELAQCYDTAADACFAGFFASRRNYDVAFGIDGRNRRQGGVLEQSWRIGGASRAEIAALEILSADPDCQNLWAETLEQFGPEAVAPSHAIETYNGQDPTLGLIRKYVMVEAYGNQQ